MAVDSAPCNGSMTEPKLMPMPMAMALPAAAAASMAKRAERPAPSPMMTSMATAGIQVGRRSKPAKVGDPAPTKTATATGTAKPMRTSAGIVLALKIGAIMKRLVQRTNTRKKPTANGKNDVASIVSHLSGHAPERRGQVVRQAFECPRAREIGDEKPGQEPRKKPDGGSR